MTLADFGYPVQTLWFSCSQILSILFRPFGFLTPRFRLSCLDNLVFLLPDFSYPVQTLWFSCSQIQAILFRPFGFLAPRFWLSCLDPLLFLLPDFGYPVYTLWFSCSQILAHVMLLLNNTNSFIQISFMRTRQFRRINTIIPNSPFPASYTTVDFEQDEKKAFLY